MQHIRIEETVNDLTHQEWVFWFDDNRCQLVLNEYILWHRETKRHKYVVAEKFDRLTDRRSTRKIDDVPFPQDLADRAKQALLDKLTVLKER